MNCTLLAAVISLGRRALHSHLYIIVIARSGWRFTCRIMGWTAPNGIYCAKVPVSTFSRGARPMTDVSLMGLDWQRTSSRCTASMVKGRVVVAAAATTDGRVLIARQPRWP